MAKNGEPVEYTVGQRTVRVSSPDKIYFPDRGITKREVVEHYLAVGGPLLRAIGERPTTLKRYPDGVTGEYFYAKRVPKGAPDWMEKARITFPSGRTAEEVCPTEPAVFVWAANLGTFDFHPWPVRRPDVDHPDELRIDVDPPDELGFADAVRVAGTVREVLADAGLTGYPKTSGGRGVHVLVRIRPEWDFVDVRHALIALGREVERRAPKLATISWWKEERDGRVFIDYNQAARDRTVASSWSVRGTHRATVSTPLTWDQLTEVHPDDFDVRTVAGWLAEHGDLHADIDSQSFGIETLLEWYERDDRDLGQAEMPYPPDYPKMPGEPKRVQPSRARPDTADDG
ncbi:non-homologous end-joining DNA ligase [Amycolatopsis cihanbeyliensis]|uniref:DNA ligase D-like protein (Predicted polymerase) n=1 Tax=Amycolatopsis cihanbeyliensis TaxID=1128664 RepID=A0A542DD95_AMYCI|nr:non-homologous end-joining DNA ligase [Amycolatopsis cihanbeyliensis]TQJ01035.1 DNA ligase D-like protein (predicted polymerase) [Amycolatopsis cihanbeyliensis]